MTPVDFKGMAKSRAVLLERAALPWDTDRASSLMKNHSLLSAVSLLKCFLFHIRHCRRAIFEGTLRRKYVLPVC